MSFETKKANKRRVKDPLFQLVFSGRGIDIGAGIDPLTVNGQFSNMVSVKAFDMNNGNAQYISKYEKVRSYDFLYSSHCLEHMLDPEKALCEWASLVKSGGYMVIVVPDEDLYEQGVFPSVFNPKHRFTFTLGKFKSWSPVSINIANLIDALLPGWKVLKIAVESFGYDYSRLGTLADQTVEGAEANIEVVLKNENPDMA